MKTQNRLQVLLAVVAIQLCFGVAYIWSVFQTGIANSLFQGDNAAAGMCYSLLLAVLALGSMIGGKLTNKFSIRAVVTSGSIILVLGFFLSGFVTEQSPWVLWITYGVLGGIGMGFSYSTTIACVQTWYPDKKGLVTGIVVAALGFGGLVFTPFVEIMIKVFGGQGVGEQKTLMALAGVFLVICVPCSLVLKNPPESTLLQHGQGLSTGEVLKQPQFYIVFFAMLLSCVSGLMMIGFAKQVAQLKGMGEMAVMGVLLISAFNSLGRFFWGLISDKIGRKKTFAILLIGSAAMSLSVGLANGLWIFVVIGSIGFFYGGLLSNFPALTSDLFGAKYQATNYGLVLLGFGVAAIASSYIAGYFKNIAVDNVAPMIPAFFIAAGCAVLSLVLILFLKEPKRISS